MERVKPAWERPGFCPHPTTGTRRHGVHDCGWCGKPNPWHLIAQVRWPYIPPPPPRWKRLAKWWFRYGSTGLSALSRAFAEGLMRGAGEYVADRLIDWAHQVPQWFGIVVSTKNQPRA